jgi:lipoyl(octanoyl) transferase
MHFPHEQWRLLITPASPGAWNMAVDEALLEAVSKDESLPCLRLYAWEPACLSLGYAQPHADIDRLRLLESGWQWVRRPTGGRAILHTDELTYSVTAPASDPRLAGGVLESYLRLSAALLAALRSLNIPAESHSRQKVRSSESNQPVCFEVPSDYEIVVAGKKLIGSAQARRKEGVLQHGTLPLWGDLTRITRVLIFPDEQSRLQAADRLLTRATTTETILGTRITWEAAVQAFVQAFQSELNISFINRDLGISELKRAEELVHEKYAHPSWLERI